MTKTWRQPGTAPAPRAEGFDGTMAACRKRAAKVMRGAEITVHRHGEKNWEARADCEDFRRAIGPGRSRREALRVLHAALEAMPELR